MKWFDDKPSDEFRARVLQAAETELAQHRSPNSRRFWLWQLAGAAGLAAAVALLYKPKDDREAAVALGDVDPKMLGDLALLEDLDLWQNLELFENEEHG